MERQEKSIRLDRFLAERGIGTRSQCRELVRRGQVTVNEQTVTAPDAKILPLSDQVICAGVAVCGEKYRYYLLNKPAGFVSATEDTRERTVLELVPKAARSDCFPVGRLDKDTVGLLLLTNDGALAHRLLSPKRHVAKTYFVKAAGVITEAMIEQTATGIPLEDFTTAPANLRVLSYDEATDVSDCEIVITEGKFHQVKRMFAALGSRVLFLKRTAMGPLVLDETLAEGAYRELTAEELTALANV